MSVFKTVTEVFDSPTKPYEFQDYVLEETKDRTHIIIKLKGGGGKTYTSMWLTLYHSIVNGVDQIICLVPATLVTQWAENWKGFGVNVCAYQGTPKERAAMDLVGADIIVMSKAIFTREWFTMEKRMIHGRERKVRVPGRLQKDLTQSKKRAIIYDELQEGLRDDSNNIWRYVLSLSRDQILIGLSATPIGSPGDVYGVSTIMGSSAFPNKRVFEARHVEEKNIFNQVVKWKDLDGLREVMDEISVTVPDSSYVELPDIVTDRVVYELSTRHMRGYQELVNNKLLEYEDKVLDLTEAKNIFHHIQQYITTPVDVKKNKELLNLLETYFMEDESPLLIFANYRATNRMILEHFGDIARGKWGEFSAKQQRQNFLDFIEGRAKILVGNPASLGVGTDGLQKVCYREAFAEIPVTPTLWEQSIWRIHRDKQEQPCIARAFTAKGTLQMRLYENCLKKADILQQVVAQEISLREAFSALQS